MFTTFYHHTLRKYVILFGTIFNDIYINRTDANDEIIQTMKVPLSYGPKEKFLARLEGDPTFVRPAMVLPRMAFEITSISYSSDRKLNTINKHLKLNPDNAGQLKYQYMQVPYDIGFTLYVMVKNADDGAQIVEQIIPYFTPEWTLTAKIIPELDLTLDFPVILNNLTLQDTYEGDFINRRAMVWTLDFVMKAYLFGPIKKQGVITLANTTFYVPQQGKTIDEAIGTTDPSLQVIITPGLTPDGKPTANAEASISRNEIESTDDYGYIVEFIRGLDQ